MHESNETIETIPVPGRDVLTEILRDGAERLLSQAIEAEVDAWIEGHSDLHDGQGRRQVVKNGHHPRRTLVTGVGPVEVAQPRVWDRRIVGRGDAGDRRGRFQKKGSNEPQSLCIRSRNRIQNRRDSLHKKCHHPTA